MPKVLSYEDKNYKQKQDIYSSLAQCFQELKYERQSSGAWNLPVQQMESILLKQVGDETFAITFYRVETGTQESMARIGDEGKKIIKEVEKELKKRFKKMTGKTLELKKVKEEDSNFEKMSRLSGETSWMLGSSRYGYGSRPVGRFAVKDTIIYSFDPSLLD